jgi:hypothetical protein
MPLLDNELARREGSHIAASTRPMRISCELSDLPAADGFGLRCKFTASVRVGPTAADRVMLAEVLLADRTSITTLQVSEYFAAALAAHSGRVAAEHESAYWLGAEGSAAMLAALRKAAEAIAFRSGLELLDPMSADITSPDYQRQQLFARQAKLAEQRAADQIGHLHRAAELLGEFHALRESAPQLSSGAALEQLSPGDRGSILQSLLQASAAAGSGAIARLFAVAGPYLAEIDPQQSAARPTLHPLPDSLGPLRSVQSAEIDGQPRLLVGARAGFYVLDPSDPAHGGRYGMTTESALGFNRVIYQPDTGFWATHAELGLFNWAEGDGSAPRQKFGPFESAYPFDSPPPLRTQFSNVSQTSIAMAVTTTGPRQLTACPDGTMLFSVGTRLFHFAGNAATHIDLPGQTGANIIAILSDGASIAAVFDDGSVWTPDATGAWACRVQRGTAVCAAGLLPWLGASRLLLATVNGPIDCIGLDDPLVTQYTSPTSAGSRALAASPACVAAISRDRQRLLLWNTWDGARPTSEIYLGAQAHHRIADIAFA